MNAPRKTGWPEPALAQDDHRGLFRWFASKPDARMRVREALPTCCEYHGFEEGGCNGRNCPEGRVDLRAILTRRIQEAEARWPRDIAMGSESADPANREPDRVAREPLPITFAEPEPFDWQALVLWIAVVVCFAAVFALSIADPRDLSTLWPRLVAAMSIT